MNFKEKFIEFLICITVIIVSLKFLTWSLEKYIPKQEHISSGIVIEKIHNEAYTDTMFITDSNGLTTFYTNYYEEQFIFKIQEKDIEESLIVNKDVYKKYNIGDKYTK